MWTLGSSVCRITSTRGSDRICSRICSQVNNRIYGGCICNIEGNTHVKSLLVGAANPSVEI